MKIKGLHKASWRWFSFLVGILSVFMLSGCEGGAGNTYSTISAEGETGSVAFHVNWESDPDKVPANYSRDLMHDFCGSDATSISNVLAGVYDAEGTLLAQGGPWLCDERSGTIKNVQAGNGRVLVVIGYNSDDHTLYVGVEYIDVIAGKTIQQSIDARMFVPELLSPIDASVNLNPDGVVLEWSSIPGAKGYEVWMSQSVDANGWLSNPTKYGEDDSIIGTTFSPPGGLPSNTQYYWAVFAVDIAGDRGYYYNSVRSFTTGSTTVSCDNIEGDWDVELDFDATDCGDGMYTETDTYTVTQTGCNVTVDTGTNTFYGTIDGSTLSWTAGYFEDTGGYTSAIVVVTFSGDTVSGMSYWNWADNFDSCSGTTSISGSRSGGIESLPTPTEFYTESGGGQVRVHWKSPLDISLWALYWSTSFSLSTTVYEGRIPLESIDERTLETATYTHTDLNNGTTYFYIITTRDDQGKESEPTSPSIAASPQISGSNETGDSFEPNDTYLSAWDNYGNPAGWENQWLTDIAGNYPSVSAADKEDLYKIETTGALTRIQIDCSFINASGDIDLYLYDAGGFEIASDESTADGQSIDYTGSFPAVYYIKVYYYDSTDSSSYNMNTYNLKWYATVP